MKLTATSYARKTIQCIVPGKTQSLIVNINKRQKQGELSRFKNVMIEVKSS
jgi:hypothetical protein